MNSSLIEEYEQLIAKGWIKRRESQLPDIAEQQKLDWFNNSKINSSNYYNNGKWSRIF